MPVIEEIVLDPSKKIISKTNPKGTIEYAIDQFMEISGYDEHELKGQSHNAIRHLGMPKVIFKWLWERLKKVNIYALVKNFDKDGGYYWVIADFEVKIDHNEAVNSLFVKRKCPPPSATETISELYKKLLAIERAQGVEV